MSGRVSTVNPALADSAKVVSLYADGQKRVISTSEQTVGQLLDKAGVTLNPGDLVEPTAKTVIPHGYFNINVYRAKSDLVVDGSHQTVVRTAYASPRLIAQAAGLKLFPEDEFEQSTVTNFVTDGVVGSKVVVKRAALVTVTADGITRQVRTQAKTVGKLLSSAGVLMGPEDVVTPAAGAAVSPGLTITVTRINDVTVTQTETLTRPTQTVADPTAAKGTSVVKAAGSDGHRTVTYHIRYRNGIEVQRDVLNVTDLVNPTPQVVSVGTKVFFAGSVEFWRPYVVTAASNNGVDPNLMMAIMSCESHGNANASNNSGPGHFGLFQYDPQTWSGLGGTMNNIYDGPTQITQTAWKIANYGTIAWNASKWCWSSQI